MSISLMDKANIFKIVVSSENNWNLTQTPVKELTRCRLNVLEGLSVLVYCTLTLQARKFSPQNILANTADTLSANELAVDSALPVSWLLTQL